MESKKLFCLLTLVFSLLMLEASMASRIPAEYQRPVISGSVTGSPPKRAAIQDRVPPQVRKWAKKSQADQANTSASAVVTTPGNVKVNVSTAVSPTGATLGKQHH